MAMIYFDDVKFEKRGQPAFWLGGIYVPESNLLVVDKQISNLAEQTFGTRKITEATEFHANLIRSRKGAYAQWDDRQALELLKQLADILDQPDLLKTFWVKIFPPKETVKTEQTLQLVAFQNLLMLLDELCQETNSAGIVIGDNENKHLIKEYVRLSLSYRAEKQENVNTPMTTQIVDTAYFTEANNSRFIQLADILVWFCQLLAQPKSPNKIKQALLRHINTKRKITNPDKILSLNKNLGWTDDDLAITNSR